MTDHQQHRPLIAGRGSGRLEGVWSGIPGDESRTLDSGTVTNGRKHGTVGR